MLRSNNIDKQGLNRFGRAYYFYKYSKKVADELDANFNWKLKIVPDVGYDFRLMGKAAGKLLYE